MIHIHIARGRLAALDSGGELRGERRLPCSVVDLVRWLAILDAARVSAAVQDVMAQIEEKNRHEGAG